MRHTLRQSGELFQWTYMRAMFFWSGVSPSRRAAIRALLEARKEAAECVRVMNKWLPERKAA